MIAEIASTYYNLVKDITQIVDYLKSLPDRIKAMIQGCIAQFMASIKAFVDQLKSLPGVLSSSIEGMLNELGLTAQESLNAAQGTSGTNTQTSNTSSNTANSMSDLIQVTLYQTTENHANTIMEFINNNFPNANVVLANASANSFSKSSTQSP